MLDDTRVSSSVQISDSSPIILSLLTSFFFLLFPFLDEETTKGKAAFASGPSISAHLTSWLPEE